MPGNVDERVVEMRIDNKQFESGAKTTISTLEKLERALKLKGDSRALDEMASSVSKFDASPMADSIDKVGEHINALGIMGRRVIENLADSIYNFATKTVKQLVIDQPVEGWNKYETKAEAVQSIMAATRDMITGIDSVDENGIVVSFKDQETQMAKVNELLEQMNWYTDETSYNFNDMAANVGKFLAAGTGLEDTFTAIMGIASWGGSAGAKPQEVSRAMYNISQAMSSGSMKAIDWKSIENAGMATLEFKQNAIDAAVAMGKLNKWTDIETQSLIKYYEAGEDASLLELDSDKLFDAKSFREGLASGWFDSEVMMEVFKRYGEFSDKLYAATESTGLEATEVLQLVDKLRDGNVDIDWDKYAHDASMAVEEFKKAIQSVSDVNWEFSENGFRMGQEAKTWTDMIEATKDAVSSEWMKTFQYIFGDYLEAKEFWTEMTSEFWDIFAAGGALRNEILDSWYSSGGRTALFGLDEENLGAFWNILNAIKSLVNPIQEALSEVFGTDTEENIAGIGKRLAELTKRFQEITSHMGLSEEAAKGLKNIFTTIFNGAKIVLKGFGGIIAIIGKFAWMLGEVLDAVLSLASGEVTLEMVQERIKNAFKNFIKQFEGLSVYLDLIKQKVLSFSDSLARVSRYIRIISTDGVDFFKEGALDRLTKFEKILLKIGQRFPILADVFNYAGYYLEKITNYFSELTFTMPTVSGVVEKITYWFSKFADAVGINNEKLSLFWNKVKGFFSGGINFSKLGDNLKEAFIVFKELLGSLFGDPAEMKVKISNAVKKLVEIVKEALGSITFRDIFKGFTNALKVSFLVQLFGVLNNVRKTLTSLRAVPDSITDVFGDVSETFDTLQSSLRMNTLLKVSVAVGILTASLVALSKVPTDKLVPAVAALGALMLLISKITKNIDNFSLFSKNNVFEKGVTLKLIPSLAANILAVAVAMGVLIHAVLAFKKNDVQLRDITKVLLLLGTTLLMIGGYMTWMKRMNADDIGKSFGLLITVFAIIGRVGKLAVKLQDVPWYKLLVIFIGIGLVMMAIGSMLTKMSALEKFDANKILQTAALMLSIGFALQMIAGAVKKLGNMNFVDMLKGIFGIALVAGGLFIAINKMANMKLNPVGIIKIAGAFVLMALAIDILMPFITVFGSIMSGVIAVIPWGKMSRGLQNFGQVLLKLVGLAASIALIGFGLDKLGGGLLKFGMGALATTGAFALIAIGILAIAAAIAVLGDNLPKFVEGLFDTIDIIKSHGEQVVDLIGVILMGVAGAILAKKLDISLAVAELIITAIYVIAKKGPEIAQAFMTVFGELQTLLKDFFGPLAEFLVQAISDLFNATAQAIEDNESEIAASVTRLIKSIVKLISTTIKTVFGEEGIGDMGLLEKAIFGILIGLGAIKVVSKGMSLAEPFSKLKDTITGGGAGAGAGGGLIAALGSVSSWLLIVGAAAIYANSALNEQQNILKENAFQGLEQSVEGYEDAIERTKARIDELKEQSKNGLGTEMSEQELGAQELLLKKLEQEYETMKNQALIVGKDIPAKTAEGIGQNSELPVNSSKTVANEVTMAIEGMADQSRVAGDNFVKGLNNGIVDAWNTGDVQSNVNSIVDYLTKSLAVGLDEHSPSKISEKAGAYYIIGLANGISNNADLPINAINDTTDPMVEALKNAMMQVATIADDDFTISPRITPVVDMSNVNAAVGSMGSLLGGSYRSYVDSVSNRAANISSAAQSVASERRANNELAFNEMRMMGERIDYLGQAITNMQIVLDTGALVGATSSRMDNQLGRMAVRKGRGN